MPIQTVISTGKVPAKLWLPIADVEESAIRQIENVANLPFVFKHLAIMPDVHTGYGATIGTVMATTDCVVPSSVGVDIGCGMAAVRTGFDADRVKARLAEIKHSIERSVPTGFNEHRDVSDEAMREWSSLDGGTPFNPSALKEKAMHQLGTLGGGNHFIEVSLDAESRVWVMLHSGSRHIGLKLANTYIDKAKALMVKYHIVLPDPYLAYLPIGEDTGKEYLAAAHWAQAYALANRRLMIERILRDLEYLLNDKQPISRGETINCHHNYVEWENHFDRNVMVTRKGAIRVREGEMAIIPGSMGAKSFIVRGKGNAESFCSSSHGAGRKMSRKEAKRRFTLDDFKKQTEGILCTQSTGVIDEAPGAYKDIDEVMSRQTDLVEPVHVLNQLLCIKGA